MNDKYGKLLSTTRARASTLSGRTLVIESESDRSRLVFSAPFRRLQQKAQVFSLESNAAVRSRLTHSLEVAQIGRFLADQIVEKLLDTRMINSDQARAFINFVENACLMHDLGNPPFGHFGEAAIAQWFKQNGSIHAHRAIGLQPLEDAECVPEDIKDVLADFLEFDGNCQGLRIATLLQWNDDEYGLNLTFTSLASYLKYIRAPLFDSSGERDFPFRKKAGFFSTEQPLVEKMWAHFGYDKSKPQRFPLAYVMEAADDIAYCISDLEDSIEKDLLKPKPVFQALTKEWEATLKAKPELVGNDAEQVRSLLTAAANSCKSDSYTFTAFRTALSRLLTDIACRTYCEHHDEILVGTCTSLINEESPGGQALEMLKNFCRTNVYRHVSVQRTELAGLTAINGLLGHFGILLGCSSERFTAALDYKTKDLANQPIIFERKLLSLFPDKHIEAYRHACRKIDADNRLTDRAKRLTEWNLRAHLMTDFISGMTDDFAIYSFQMLSGIKVE